MSVATPSSFSCIKLSTFSSSSSPSSTSSSSSYSSASASSTCSTLKYSTPKPTVLLTIRNSQAEGPLRRPVAQPVRPQPPTPPPLQQPPSPPPPPSAPPGKVTSVEDKNVITMEFQRQKAKELQEYFKKKKLEDVANRGPFFGFIGKNEIANGRWAMFGFAVGLLTEYATGSSFVDQIKILLSNFGIVDLE